MIKIIQALVVSFAIVGLSACSITPGIPGLKSSSSRYTKAQKEGVDYKLIVINGDTINKQKSFDYASYVREKKRKAKEYDSKVRFKNKEEREIRPANKNTPDDIQVRLSARVENQYVRQTDPIGVSSAGSMERFEGITSSDNKANYQYYIGKGDVLNITVWDHPSLTTPSENNAFGGHTVGNDGRFYFPYSGKINAVGKTIRNIRDELETKLGSYITKPQVSVSISQYRSQRVYTSGALITPSTLMVDDTPTTVRDAISKSGGLKPNLYTGFATLARNGKNISIDLNRMLKYNDNRQNFILKNDDRLNVVERTELGEFNRKLNLDVKKENTLSSVRISNELKSLKILSSVKLQYELEKERSIARLKKELEKELKSEQAKVFVMGEVLKPGSVKYQLEDGMTLAEAINDAGSFKEDSVDPKGIFVVRRELSSDQVPTVYQLSMASVQSIFFAEQFDIRPRDIVYVTATPSIRWNRVIGQLLPSLAILNTFRNFN